MLTRLFIKNYALIDRMDIEFAPGLNVITGETGTGKSIMLKGLGLILGKRAEKAAIRDENKKIIVEGHFDISGLNLKPLFDELDLDWEKTSIIRREISPSGKSRAFVNDTPVRLDTLEQIASRLVDIHSQHQHLLLQDKNFRFTFIDTLAGHEKIVEEFQKKRKEYSETVKKKTKLLSQKQQLQQSADYRNFQIRELEQIDWNTNWEELENQLKTYENQSEILEKLQKAIHLLENENFGIFEQFRELRNLLSDLSAYNPRLSDLSERFENLFVELQEINLEISGNLQEFEMLDIHEKEKIEQTLNHLYKLMLKHQVQTPGELQKLYEKWIEEENDFSRLDMEIENLSKQEEKLYREMESLSNRLRKGRLQIIPLLERELNKLLAELGMEHSRVKFELTPTDFNDFGTDNIKFLLSSDKGKTFGEVRKIASGGEMSRLMLAIKYLLSKKKQLPTIIFDEIDAGISGEIARKMSNLMEEMSRNLQIITITHLPQTAVKGKKHFKVFKKESGGRVHSGIKELNKEERIKEIAEMIEGKPPSESALKHAEHLLKN